jgi:glycosyltransferase involved in cell wall biosynthesis/GT2 family glycosyltransferase
MRPLKRLEQWLRGVVPRRRRYAIKGAWRDLRSRLRAVVDRTGGRVDRTARNAAWGHAIRADHHDAVPSIVVLLSDPAERAGCAAELAGEWCRVADPHDYVPRAGEWVHAPASADGMLSRAELRSVHLSLACEPTDLVVVSRSIQPLPTVAVASLRHNVVVRAGGYGWLSGTCCWRGRVCGRVVRLLGFRPVADGETSIDALLGTRCSLAGPRFQASALARRSPDTAAPTPAAAGAWSHPPAAAAPATKHPTVLVLPAMFAVGGVERNTVEVLRKLQDRYRFVVATTEPHEPSRGALHAQLHGLCEAVYDLGEIADASRHAELLAVLHATHRFDCVWIVNGSPWLSRNLEVVRRTFADCAIVDQQVYDTEHGWISCYQDPAIASFDRHVAINARIADAFVTRFGISPARVELVYHAIDADRWEAVAADEPRKARSRDRLGKPHGAAIYGFVGRLTEQKQPLDFLDMARRSWVDGRPDTFVVVGDGPLAPVCHDYVARHRLGNVRFEGFVADPADLLLSCSGLVITSAYEGLPIVSLEAMAIGLPILATDVGDLRIVAEKHATSVTFFSGSDGESRYRDFRSWTDALPGHAARAAVGAAGVRQAFGAGVIADQYDRVFQAAMATQRAETARATGRQVGFHGGAPGCAGVSIVVPTFNRREQLARLLDRFADVAGDLDHEIIVVDDGSTDGTADMLAARSRVDRHLRHVTIRNGGPGRARNIGAARAEKEVVLFVGDDILPADHRFVRTHARLHGAHRDTGFAVLGKVVWPNDGTLDVTAVMRHIQGIGGEQFGYPHFRPYGLLDWRFFYTCNVSVKRDLVADWETEGFSPAFTAAAFEDVEFAYRMSLRPAGLRIYYDPAALGEHHHRHAVRSFLDRQFNAGTMASVLVALHPATAETLGLSRLIAAMHGSRRHSHPDRVADLLSVIEGAKSFAMLLEAYGGLGDALWHTPYLQAVFELAMLHGFVVGEATRGGQTEEGYVDILGSFLRRVEPIVATELPGTQKLIDSLRSRLAA